MAGIAKNHDYHMVEPSPWPFVMSVSVLIMAMGGIFWMHEWTPFVFFIGLAGVLYTMYAWWSDVVWESVTGDHTPCRITHSKHPANSLSYCPADAYNPRVSIRTSARAAYASPWVVDGNTISSCRVAGWP